MQEDQGMGAMFHAGSMSGRRVEPGNAADKALTGSLDALETARGELLTRVSVARVGVTGSAADGFQVDLKVLRDMNNKVEKALGRKLVLAERLQDRSTDAETDTVSLQPADLESMRPANQPLPSSDGGAKAHQEWLAARKKSEDDMLDFWMPGGGASSVSKSTQESEFTN
ncbi:hypothetical protein CMUS01_10336 [Colletotrichum musicola]|uniref:Uncharacterized protein n=1 Tax=Colletotrichum musicola TaxID=2175873 RepID=A0A8H6K4C1_9PEZI|nr:hypothetical protein CMUS01_10336 [Colletotrichum musicola]